MSGGKRIARVNELLRREIAELLERFAETPPNVLVTVGAVVTTPDLRHASVNVSILGGDAGYRGKLRRLLESHRPELQRCIARDVILKYTPVLQFIFDDTIAKGDKVLAIINELEEGVPAKEDPPEPATSQPNR